MTQPLDNTGRDFMTEVELDGAAARLRVVGEVDLVTAPRLQGALASACGVGREVVVDLHGVRFMDSTGLRALLQARSVARRLGGSLRLEMPDDGAVAHLLDIAGVRPLFS